MSHLAAALDRIFETHGESARDKLLATLRELGKPGDPECAHSEADDALLAFINDAEITEAFNAIEKWYA